MRFDQAYSKLTTDECFMYRSSIFGMIAFLSPENNLVLSFIDPDTFGTFITAQDDPCYGLTPIDYEADDWEVSE